MKKPPSFAFWAIIVCVVCVIAVVSIRSIPPVTDENFETYTPPEATPEFCMESYIDMSGYFGMIEHGDEKLFFTSNAQTIETADFGTETFNVSYETNLTDTNDLSYTVLGSTLYYSEGIMLRSLNLDTGVHKTEHTFAPELADIFVCGTYGDELGRARVAILTIAYRENQSEYYKEIYSYNTVTGESEKLCDVNITEQNIGMKYLVSDENYAYFAKFHSAGNLYKLDLKTGEFSKFASDKLITALRLKNSFPNQAAIFENHLYFKVIGKPFGLYRANLETGEIEEYFRSGFTGNIAAFCFEDGILYTAVQNEAFGDIDTPDYRGIYSVFTIDTESGEYNEISEKVEIASEIRGLAVDGNKALIYGSNPTFVDLKPN